MKIVDMSHVEIVPPTMTLNEIPVGTIFRGTITGAGSNLKTTGIFYKAHGRSTIRNGVNSPFAHLDYSDVVVVRLDIAGLQHVGYANCWLHCAPIENYEPLCVTLTINKVIK